MIILRGVGVSPGAAVGPVVWYERFTGAGLGGSSEVKQFEQARAQVAKSLSEISARLRRKGADEGAAIIDAQRQMVNDPEVARLVEARMREEHITVAQSLQEVFAAQAAKIRGLPDALIAARAQDVEDVASHLLRALSGVMEEGPALTSPSVIFAEDLTPSETAQMDRRMVLGFATLRGGPDSHTAILARSLKIPAVVGVDPVLGKVQAGTTVLMDGSTGIVVVEMDAKTIREHVRRQRAERSRQSREPAAAPEPEAANLKPTFTRDGRRVAVAANISSLHDVPAALAAGAESVGLLRTELLFSGRATPPGEEEQYEFYSSVAGRFAPNRVVIRTLDAGGDKPVPGAAMLHEVNPALGLRGIRLSLAEPDLFRVQLRAICRASAENDIAVMFPMVSAVSEMEQAIAVLRQVQEELRAARVPFDAEMDTGIMVETPAAALLMDELAPLCGFLSLGTNDLAQYTMAADRTNPSVAGLLRPVPKAVLRLVKMTIDRGHASGLRVSMCGEAAGDPALAPVFLGMGLDEFSVEPGAIGAVKEAISQTSMVKARRAARKAWK
ncbi:MAG: phosphoenolpyruvate--protein phosphotransferase [Bacillota bacterium]|nr:phosphoenolpyruvate--protein phosphotransferase [Bacillota bacterium]